MQNFDSKALNRPKIRLLLRSFVNNTDMSGTSSVKEKLFGKLDDGTDVKLFKLTNQNGMIVEVHHTIPITELLLFICQIYRCSMVMIYCNNII